MFKHLLSAALVTIAFALAPVAASAQEAPKGEVSVGYSYLNFDRFTVDRASLHGFDVSVAGHVNDWFGIEGDVSGHYLQGGNVHHVMGGPRFTYRHERVEPFVHVLAGAAFIDAGDVTQFSMAFGGGVDVKVNDNFAIRAVQVDYTPIFFHDGALHNARITTGVVIRF